MNRIKSVGIGLTAAVLVTVTFAFTQAGEDAAPAPSSTPPVDIVTVQRAASGGTVAIGGTVQAKDTVKLTAQMPGRVIYLAGDVGSRFKKGDVLVRLDDDALQAQLRSAYAAQASADSALRNAGAQYHRELVSPGVASNTPGGMGMPSMMDQMMFNPMQSMMGMRQPGVERRTDLYSRQSQIDQARSALLQAQAQIRQIQAQLRDTKSVAPFSGVISAKYVELGDTVQPGQPLLDYADTDVLEVIVDIPAGLRPGLQIGRPLKVRLDVTRSQVTGHVTRIAPVADPIRHTFGIKVALPRDTQAEAGMYAEVLVPDPRGQAMSTLVIPSSAIVEKGGLYYVFVVDDQNRAVLRLVRLGEPYGDGAVIVLAGLSEGTRIIRKPPPGLRSGQQL